MANLRSIAASIQLKDDRSRKVAANIAKSFIVKFFSTLITLSLIPISLHYVEEESYGVWLTIASVITWFGIFDFGLSNGLTNRLTEAFAKDDVKLANVYLSTTYFILLIITGILALVFVLLFPFINWNAIFSTKMDRSVLNKTIAITFGSFSLLFLLKPVTSLLMAKQKHFLASIIQVTGNFAALSLIYVLGPYISNNRFLFLSTALAFSYPLALLIFSFVLYNTQYKDLRPSYKTINLAYKRDLFGLSFKFFFIQISVIAILTSNNFLIAHFIDNKNVTYYNIAYRLYSIVSIFQLMFLQPLWTAFTNAYTLQDYDWIRQAVTKINKMNILLCIILIIMLTFHNIIYRLWIGPETSIPYEIDVLLFIYFIFYLFMQTYVYFINGVGKINLQALFSIITIILQFPLAYILIKKMNLGISGLLMLNIFWVVISLLLWKKQYKVIMSGRVLHKMWQ